MFDDLPYATAIALAIALVPALVQWWSSRALVRAIDDAALPERLAANQRRTGIVLGVAIGVLIAGWPSTGLWSIPLALLGRIAAAYPLRKALYDETWSLAGYLAFVLRGLIAFFGFWLTVIWLPLFANLTGSGSWLFASVVAAVLLLWNARAGDIVRVLMRARAIEDAALLARFSAVVSASVIPAPRFEYFDLRGGAIANAIALPAVRRSAVVFTDTLLSMLTPDEAVAICAHEIAHLEYYNARYMRRARLIIGALITIGVATIPLARFVESTTGVFFLWMGVIVLALIMRARFRQHHETVSDLRAVALTGNAEALISGLTKLHTFARIPRRWDASRERHATHPSLARRIRAIRAAASIAPAPLGAIPTFRSENGEKTLTFTEAGLEIVDGRNAATHVLSYAGLTELRLGTGKGKQVRLIAVQRGGQRWEIPIATPDVAAVQAALDVADARLAEPEELSRHWPQPIRVLAGFAALAALTLGQFAMLVLGVLAAIEQSPPFLASAGAASVASGLLTLRQIDGFFSSSAGLAGLLVAFGGLLLWLAWTSRRDVKPKRTRLLLAGLSVCAACAWAMLLSDGFSVVELHHHAREFPSTTVFSLALATALTMSRGRSARLSALVACVAGLSAAAAGSIAFLDRFAHDPLLVQAASMPLTTISSAPTHSFDVPFDVSEIVLSPEGAHLALMSETSRPGRDEELTTFHVGAAGQSLSTVDADDLVFLDADHVVVLDQHKKSARLREMTVTAGLEVEWQQNIDDIHAPTLSLEPSTRRWRLLGWDRGGQLAQIEGTIGTAEAVRRRWPLRQPSDGWPVAYAISSRGPLLVDLKYESSSWRGTLATIRPLLGEPLRTTLTFRRADSATSIDGGRSRLRAHCVGDTRSTGRVLCTVFDGSRSRFVALDADSDAPVPLGAVDGRFFTHRRVSNGWVVGWVRGNPVAVKSDGSHALQVGRSSGYVSEVAVNDTTIATVMANGDSSTITLYKR